MDLKKTTDFIINWLKDYCLEANQKGFVVGVSGGIDSALTSTLAAETGLKVLCVEMPIYQDADQLQRSTNHIAWLKSNYPNVSSESLDLSQVYQAFSNLMPNADRKELEELGLINSRARLRMTSLYYLASIHSCLVAGTGNKIEDFGVGFYTKYGDGGVDLSPIADLTKSEVFLLAESLGVDKTILNAPPTDGLWGDSRTDEDQLGASYPELEWAMEQDENKKSIKDFEGRKREVFEIYKRLNRLNQHKMKPIPVCEIPGDLKK